MLTISSKCAKLVDQQTNTHLTQEGKIVTIIIFIPLKKYFHTENMLLLISIILHYFKYILRVACEPAYIIKK